MDTWDSWFYECLHVSISLISGMCRSVEMVVTACF